MTHTTARLSLPYIMTSQSQKEVTHNEALNILDVVIQGVVQDVDVNTPPGTASAGQCWVVGSSPTGAWEGKPKQIAQSFNGGGWFFVSPFKQLKLWVEATEAYHIYDGIRWIPEGLLLKESGESLRVEHKSEAVYVSGEFTETTIQIPEGSLVLCVNVRVLKVLSGPTSFSVGVADDLHRYGHSIGVQLDSSNIGITNHLTYYVNTPIRLTANGASFTGGVAQVTLQYLKAHGPWKW